MGYGNLNVGYRGAHNTGSDLKNQKDVSDEFIVNLQLGLRSQDGRWDGQIWARNLLDNQLTTLVFNSVFQGGSFSTFLGPPRMFGATLRANF
jgi:outer membrane receptor protein involved in Fe transport